MGRGVRRGIHKRIHRRGVSHFDFDEPAIAEGVGVEGGGVVVQAGVDLNDLAADCGVDIRGCFDGFDLADAFAWLDFGSDGLHLDVGDVGELIDGKLGDAEREDVTIELVPFVGFGVLAIIGRIHGRSLEKKSRVVMKNDRLGADGEDRR